jgi:hypothetical protein
MANAVQLARASKRPPECRQRRAQDQTEVPPDTWPPFTGPSKSLSSLAAAQATHLRCPSRKVIRTYDRAALAATAAKLTEEKPRGKWSTRAPLRSHPPLPPTSHFVFAGDSRDSRDSRSGRGQQRRAPLLLLLTLSLSPPPDRRSQRLHRLPSRCPTLLSRKSRKRAPLYSSRLSPRGRIL